MQRAVERNSENYAMCAVNPSRVSFTGTFSVREVVDSIAARTAALLEIVNYDVVARGHQTTCQHQPHRRFWFLLYG
jgi:hypothetical protein